MANGLTREELKQQVLEALRTGGPVSFSSELSAEDINEIINEAASKPDGPRLRAASRLWEEKKAQ